MPKLLLGPILGLEGDTDYTVCFATELSASTVTVEAGGESVRGKLIGAFKTCKIWRCELDVPAPEAAQTRTYQISVDGEEARSGNGRRAWSFHVPGNGEAPRMAYTSCNGFSSEDLRVKTEAPYRLWERIKSTHEGAAPFHLLIMGGDQLYADSIWQEVKELKNKWLQLPREDRQKRKPNKAMIRQIEAFYEELYLKRWQNPAMADCLASIPSVMMWDDHDIFDGWGSYPDDLQSCPVYQAIFEVAKRFFEVFQIRSPRNKTLLSEGQNHHGRHYAFGLQFRGQHILGLDNRAERTLNQVMSADHQWPLVNTYLEKVATEGNLFVLSAVPVVYRDFSFTESFMDVTPWEEELTDDLKDHWRSKEHEGERARLIMRLLKNARMRSKNQTAGRTVILSGDVHLGGLGVINDHSGSAPVKVHQVISSGIVHPAPSRIQWLGIMAVTNDRTEHLNEDKSIAIDMLRPYSGEKYIRSRNFVTLDHGTDNKLWVNWVCENGKQPHYPLA